MTRHVTLIIAGLIRNRPIRAYVVVVILKAPSRLSGFLSYRSYKPACARQAPLREGL